jgi:hypothetical protein
MSDNTATEKSKAPPAHKIRRGALEVTIWRRTNDSGTWYNAVPSRDYKQGDDTWKETHSLNQDDLLPMAKLLDLADSWIAEKVQADRKAAKAKEPETEAA